MTWQIFLSFSSPFRKLFKLQFFCLFKFLYASISFDINIHIKEKREFPFEDQPKRDRAIGRWTVSDIRIGFDDRNFFNLSPPSWVRSHKPERSNYTHRVGRRLQAGRLALARSGQPIGWLVGKVFLFGAHGRKCVHTRLVQRTWPGRVAEIQSRSWPNIEPRWFSALKTEPMARAWIERDPTTSSVSQTDV